MPSALIHIMTQAAERAGKALIRDFNEVEHLQVSTKGPSDFVSHADRNAERIIYEYLAKARPDWGFIMEESGMVGNQENRFIIDPLDGTANFLHAIPHFCVSIAAETDGHLEAGVIFDPIKYELFTAERNKGAFLNHRRLGVSKRRTLHEALLAIYLPTRGRGGGSHHQKERILAQIAALMHETAGIRRMGSAALDLAYVAAGRLDGFWEKGLSVWDVAAGVLMVKEAGGSVVHTDGSKVVESTVEKLQLLATNEALYEELLQILQEIDKNIETPQSAA